MLTTTKSEETVMKSYRVSISTDYGVLTVEDVIAENEDDAFDTACDEIQKSLDWAKLDSIDELRTF